MSEIKKKTICLVTNWYPTKENPYQGQFFKEQAFAVSERFDFIVFRYVEKIRQLRDVEVFHGGIENNTEEYNIQVRIPIHVIVADMVHDFFVRKIRHKTIDGVGRYISCTHTKFRMKVLEKILKNYVCEKFDLLYCIDAQMEAAIVNAIANLTNKPYIVSEHAPIPWPGTVLDDVSKSAIEHADLFMAISYDKIRQMQLLNIKLPQIWYIGNLVDESQFTIELAHNKENIKTFIIVAANSYYKNYDMFFDVINRLCEITDIHFRVMIVGYGANKGYSKNVEEFEDKVHKAKFADRVELIREVPHSEVSKLLNKADAFIMTSIQEGQPVSAMEAACCGLPIFSTRCGGVEDYINDSMGRIYNISDSEAMAQGLKEYLEGKIIFNNEYIHNQAVSRFGKREFTRRFIDAIDLVLEKDN